MARKVQKAGPSQMGHPPDASSMLPVVPQANAATLPIGPSLIAPPPQTDGTVPLTAELGARGLRRAGAYINDDFITVLNGVDGRRIFREMRDNDPVIGACLFATEMLLRRTPWEVVPGEPEEALLGDTSSRRRKKPRPEDVKAAKFIRRAMRSMRHSWSSFVVDATSFLTYGFYVGEIVYKYDDKGAMLWDAIAGRNQETIYNWEFLPNGEVQYAWQWYYLLPVGQVKIPLSKCVHIRTTNTRGNPEGRSLLRNAYLPWYYSKKLQVIEAIGIERDLSGMPVMYVPQDWTATDATDGQKAAYANAQTIVSNLRRDEQAGLVLPRILADDGKTPLLELELLSAAGNRPVDVDKTINRYDQRIAATFLADFLLMGQGKVGSYALAEVKSSMFEASLSSVLEMIADPFNRSHIPELLRLNGLKGRCYLRAGDPQRDNTKVVVDMISNLVKNGLVRPNDEISETLTTMLNLPAGASVEELEALQQKLEEQSMASNAQGGE